jgi:hypothetical protein
MTSRDPYRAVSVATVAASPKARPKDEPKRRPVLLIALLMMAILTVVIVIIAVSGGGSDTHTLVADNKPAPLPVEVPGPVVIKREPAPVEPAPSPTTPTTPTDVPRVVPKDHPIVVRRTRPADKPADAPIPPPTEHEVAPPPGVKTEGSVHFIEVTPGASKSRAADYAAKRFDPLAYLPKATALARELMADAQLTGFEFDPVYPDGHVDITTGRDHEYDFRSPSRSGRPAGTPKNLKLDQSCLVHVEIGTSQAVATSRTSETCTERIVRVPHCTFAQLFAQAKAQGKASDDIVVRIAWLFDEKWFFDTDPDTLGKGGGVNSFADRCP